MLGSPRLPRNPDAVLDQRHLYIPRRMHRWRVSIGSTDDLTDSECQALPPPSAAAMQCGLDTLLMSSVGRKDDRYVSVRVANFGALSWQDAIRRIGCSIPEARIRWFRDQCRIVFDPSCRHRRLTTSVVAFHFYGGLGSKCEGA